ncbi:hypothetical protein LCGC14_0437490 [marine sediment metagenome]|uniref:Uncharacterized protein n=1 Tax=marine sediment metagenome TaxID=412755 RepID=A0A0F9VVR5_9ZZZZ
MQLKKVGMYRPVSKDDKKITKRERRLGRVVINKQVNYTQKEWKAKKCKEAETRKKRNEGNMRKPEQDIKNQQRCVKCSRVVGCDMNGRKHKCDCGKIK